MQVINPWSLTVHDQPLSNSLSHLRSSVDLQQNSVQPSLAAVSPEASSSFSATSLTTMQQRSQQVHQKSTFNVNPPSAPDFSHSVGAFFWGYSSYSYSGLGITEYTEFQFQKERS